MIVIVDSYAWIEFLAGSEKATQLGEVLATAEGVVTPDLVLAEVARKLARDGVATPLLRRKMEDLSTLSRVLPISVEFALGVFQADVDLRKSAKLRRLKPPGLSDAVILSTARTLGGRVLTGDPHFQTFAETLWIGQ